MFTVFRVIDGATGSSRFNILHTAPDPNFDRIAYLAKLVFSTKIATISLIDEYEEYVFRAFHMYEATNLSKVV